MGGIGGGVAMCRPRIMLGGGRIRQRHRGASPLARPSPAGHVSLPGMQIPRAGAQPPVPCQENAGILPPPPPRPFPGSGAYRAMCRKALQTPPFGGPCCSVAAFKPLTCVALEGGRAAVFAQMGVLCAAVWAQGNKARLGGVTAAVLQALKMSTPTPRTHPQRHTHHLPRRSPDTKS